MSALTVISTKIELWKLLVSISLPLLLFVLQRLYQNHDQAKERRRKLYAEAFTACMEYKEFPYVIYRRGKSDPEAERLRISTELRHVQKSISYHHAWIKTESTGVSIAYDELVTRTRQVAGKEMSKAWDTKPIKSDHEMNVGNKIDWQDLSAFEDAFIEAARKELGLF